MLMARLAAVVANMLLVSCVTAAPIMRVSEAPTGAPSAAPSQAPSHAPTAALTAAPTAAPSFIATSSSSNPNNTIPGRIQGSSFMYFSNTDKELPPSDEPPFLGDGTQLGHIVPPASATYQVQVAAAGTYAVKYWLSTSAADATVKEPVSMFLTAEEDCNTAVPMAQLDGTLALTKGATTKKAYGSGGIVELEAGAVMLKVCFTEVPHDMLLDSIQFTAA
eukprot:TRINITY_DN540_c0_g1_i1.p1 TRINITY_DN540_c0_g1~~TRINITY_DN540_c0_g1_i1.p1  ORF type:complete len:220 (+),score=50.10 TRINITY_DN540_c0_g1_i1:190-849(+)